MPMRRGHSNQHTSTAAGAERPHGSRRDEHQQHDHQRRDREHQQGQGQHHHHHHRHHHRMHSTLAKRQWICMTAPYCCGGYKRFCLLLVMVLIIGATLVLLSVDPGGPAGSRTLRTQSSSHLANKPAKHGQRQQQQQQSDVIVVEDTISPFTSVPPAAIGLDVVHNPRHACLSKMRQRHHEALQSYLQGPPPDHILLVDPAYHSNVGDHMITVGELQFLYPYLLEHQSNNNNNNSNNTSNSNSAMPLLLSQCSYIQAGEYVPPCEVEIPRLAQLYHHPVAIWHGGGNWGDLWRRAQEPRIASLRILLDHGYTVVTMPNSWYYQDERLEQQDIAQIRTNVELGRNASGSAAVSRLVFCWREEFSYQKGSTLLPFATHVLVPDIAFQLGPYLPIRPPKSEMVDIVLLLRDDHESVVGQRNRVGIRTMLSDIPNGKDITFSIVDWNDRLVRFDSRDFFFTSTAIQLLSIGQVVICDRLHAAILAYLMGVPFIFLDQISGKITKTLSASMSACDDDGGSGVASPRMESAISLAEALMKAVDWLPHLDTTPELSRAAKREQLQREQHSIG